MSGLLELLKASFQRELHYIEVIKLWGESLHKIGGAFPWFDNLVESLLTSTLTISRKVKDILCPDISDHVGKSLHTTAISRKTISRDIMRSPSTTMLSSFACFKCNVKRASSVGITCLDRTSLIKDRSRWVEELKW